VEHGTTSKAGALQSERPSASSNGRLAHNEASARWSRLQAVLTNAPSVSRAAAAAKVLNGVAQPRQPEPRQGRWRALPARAEGPVGSGVAQMKWVGVRGNPTQVYWDGSGPEPAHPPPGCQRVDNPHPPLDPRAGAPPHPGGGGFLSARPDQLTAASFGVLGNLQHEPHLASGAGYSEPVDSGVDEQGRFVIVRDAGGGYVRLNQATQYGMLSIFSNAQDATGPRPDAAGPASASASPPAFGPMSAGVRITSSLDAADVVDWSGVRKGWTPNQQGAMGNLSAADAARAAGIAVTGAYHWLHVVAFSMGGLDKTQPNVPENLLVGTLEANMIHGVVEKAAKQLARSGLTLALSAIPEVSIDSARHVFRRLQYIIRNARAPFWQAPWGLTLELLDHNPGHHGDYDFVLSSMKRQLAGPGDDGSASSSSASSLSAPPEEDRQLHRALVQSVQDIANAHGVSRRFEVGHADGRHENCSILSVFSAAGIRLSTLEGMLMRERLHGESGIPATGPLDLADPQIAEAIGGLVAERVGPRQIVVIRPSGPFAHDTQAVAGSGQQIFIFYASGHFSPAMPRSSSPGRFG
jgi:hypothetical protein